MAEVGHRSNRSGASAGADVGCEVDPALRSIARVLPRGYGLRAGLVPQRLVMGLLGGIGARRDVQVVALAPGVSGRLHRSSRDVDPAPVLLWLHGGGYTMGSARQEDVFCRQVSRRLGIAVAAVDYRLAPEHPYPKPLEDCYAALSWVSRQEWADPARIAIGGVSAGGGLAASLAQLVHDRGEMRLALQMLVHPMLDDRTGASPTPGRRIMWSDSDNQIAWRWYLGDADPHVAVPARRADLSGLPPAWIGVGTLDMFYGECLDYASRLRAAGVQCHEEIAVGAFHIFDLLVPNAPISLEFFGSQCRHLRAAYERTADSLSAEGLPPVS